MTVSKRKSDFPYRVLEGFALGLAILITILVIRMQGTPMDRLKVAIGYGLLLFLFFLAMAFLLEVLEDQIDLTWLIGEMDGGASTSRFQLLVFAFVVAFSLFLVVVSSGKFPEIPNSVLLLLGISASTYGASKGLQVASGKTGEPGDTASGETPVKNETASQDNK